MYSIELLKGENAYCLLGYVVKAMKKEGKTREEIAAFLDDAKSSDYEYLQGACEDMVDLLNDNISDENNELEYSHPDEFLMSGFMGEGVEYPNYDDVELDFEEEIPVTKKLFPMDKKQKCLYMTAKDLENEGVNAKMLGRILGRFTFDSCICDGALQVVFGADQQYEFYNDFNKALKMDLHLSVNMLEPYIYNYDEMQPIINASFKKAFGNRWVNESSQYDIDELWDNLVNCNIATEDEIKLVTDIKGYSLETLLSILYARTGYRTWQQYADAEL